MITVIGLDGSPLSRVAAEAVAGATLLVGARRHLAAAGWTPDGRAAGPGGRRSDGPDDRQADGPADRSADGPADQPGGRRARVIVLGPLRPALDALAAHGGDAVVLASGDPGFFGIVRVLRERGLGCTVLPATSSVALAFARAGLPWDDAVVVSAHGRELRAAVNVSRAYGKVAVLTGPGQGPAEIGAALAGWPRRLLVAEDLGDAGERLTECTPADAAARTWTDPNVVLVLAPPHLRSSPAPTPATNTTSATPVPDRTGGAGVIMGLLGSEAQQTHDHADPERAGGPGSHIRPGGPSWCWPRWVGGAGGPGVSGPGVSGPGVSGPGDQAGWALAEEAFEHRDSMVTKPEVRALALARLGPGPGLLVWDVGAGSGSVAVECARFGAAVIAVDRDPEQCARVAANARRHGTGVRVVEGAAPEALDGLPDPDAVFVGGGGLAVLGAVAARRPPRIVLALAAIQRAGHGGARGRRVHGGRHPAAGQPPGPAARRRAPPGRRQPGLPRLGGPRP